MRIAVIGGSGFVGRHLRAAVEARGDEAVVLSLRDPSAAAATASLCDAVVNLAGEPIGQRWSDEVKQRIVESRTTAPQAFLDALAGMPKKPSAYVSASAVGYYGTSEDATFTESSSPGSGFLAECCVRWEATATSAAQCGMRVCCVRSGMVLGDGGVLERILPIFRTGTGGRIGSGNQWFSWIHIDDAVGIYLLAVDGASGALNATAPNPVRNAEFTQTLAGVLHRPASVAVPAFMLRMMLGEGAQIALEGQRVLPERTSAVGYTFKYPELRPALEAILDG